MGCDIHLQVEYQRYAPEWMVADVVPDWRIDDPPLDPEARSYVVFDFLAGVRGCSFVPQIPNRGLPPDAWIRGEQYEERGPCGFWFDHSPTWATWQELVGLPWENPPMNADAPDPLDVPWLATSHFRRWLLEHQPLLDLVKRFGGDKVRIIMGFDS